MTPGELNLLSDERLVRIFKDGDEQAFEVLCGRYERVIQALSHTFFIFCGDGDDLKQEGLFGLLSAVNRFDENKEGASSFGTFAHTCIRARLLNAVNGEKKEKRLADTLSVSFDDLFAEEGDSASASVEDTVINSESVKEKVKKIKKTLSPFEIKVFELYLEGYSYTEIAEILKKRAKSVDNALQRIKDKSRKAKR